MTETTDRTTIRLDIEVAVPPARAFEVFTEQFDRIKPREQNLLAVDIAETVFEPHVGGEIYDRGIDGTECRWAQVLVFEPPQRFVMGWRIGSGWQLETDPERMSEVEVTFTPIEPNRTRVDLVHRNLDQHGDGWESLLGVGGDQGWPLYLQRYAELVASPTT